MNRKLILPTIALLLLSLGSFFYLWNGARIFYPELLPAQDAATVKAPVKELPEPATKKEVIAPPPIQTAQVEEGAALTRSGIIKFTNDYRILNGLPPLEENALLRSAAEAKIKDMFQYQYFAHESPSGVNVGELVEKTGYDYLAVGENLAEGNFENDEALVKAWILSPGHRANIVNPKYTEIGVAVGQNFWNGRLTWMAVQEFAMPASLCPSPDESLKQQIEVNTIEINTWFALLEAKKAELDSLSKTQWREYNRKVEEYNNLVVEYNALIEETKVLVSAYNSQVSNFNTCVK